MLSLTKLWIVQFAGVMALSYDLNVMSKRTNSCNATTYSASTGLTFSLYCDLQIPATYYKSAFIALGASDVYACMDKCATQSAVTTHACEGIVYYTNNGTCMLIDTDLGGVQLQADPTAHSATVSPPTQLTDGYDTSCPYTNGSLITTSNGMEFQIVCGLDILGLDYCPYGSVSCPYHAASLMDCMDLCTESHALCAGVSYNPDLKAGFANCYPKYSWPNLGYRESAYISGGEESWVTHSAFATVTNGSSIPVDCTNATHLFTSNGQNFITNCNMNLTGNDIASFHENSIQDCLDACSKSDPCVGVVYDAQLTQGWENCYLKNSSTGVLMANQDVTLALLSSGSSSTGLSKAWIAGPVIGSLLAIALVIGLVLWMRRKSQKSKKRNSRSIEVHEQVFQKAELSGTAINLTKMDVHELDVSPQDPIELEGLEHRHELPATRL